MARKNISEMTHFCETKSVDVEIYVTRQFFGHTPISVFLAYW